jgi:hypothetical protein
MMTFEKPEKKIELAQLKRVDLKTRSRREPAFSQK